MKLTVSFFTALMLSTAAMAHEVKVGALEIIHAAIPAPAAMAKSAGGFMAISNDGPTADRLIGAEVAFAAKAEVHTTEMSSDGVARMKHVDALEIPAGETVVLERGGYHIMLMGLTQTLEVGAMLPATLIFENAGRVEIEFMVDPADGSADHSKMDHGTMDHGTMDHGTTGHGAASHSGN